MNNRKRCGIVAMLISIPHDKEEETSQRYPTTIEYLDAIQLREFLMGRDKPYIHGILQQFVEPKVNSSLRPINAVIQAAWHPSFIVMEQVSSVYNLDDRRVSLTERLLTVEKVQSTTKVRSPALRGKIKRATDGMARHLHSVLPQYRVAGMVCYFKLDQHGHLWFLWCSSIRIDSVTVPRGVVDKKPISTSLTALRRKPLPLTLPATSSDRMAQLRKSTDDKDGSFKCSWCLKFFENMERVSVSLRTIMVANKVPIGLKKRTVKLLSRRKSFFPGSQELYFAARQHRTKDEVRHVLG
eukprot:TRINITY_DN1552_c0_g1_i5.p1 TRINITY_DN1552_c0_g1~~TRINITY_DN1552_c0_g1_i5.p1  ORF type:complete len:326 (+),score=52.36 TRINITY_DN1552_c0_g1_i5:90-980(+)